MARDFNTQLYKCVFDQEGYRETAEVGVYSKDFGDRYIICFLGLDTVCVYACYREYSTPQNIIYQECLTPQCLAIALASIRQCEIKILEQVPECRHHAILKGIHEQYSPPKRVSVAKRVAYQIDNR